jgi:hypothetical protein
VTAIDGDRQAGGASTPSAHAALWAGTVASYVDLTPPGFESTSGAYGLRGLLQQAGYVALFDTLHAALWRGTAASFLDLNPPSALQSFVFATDGVVQGGYVYWPFGQSSWIQRAVIWSGTPESFVDVGQNTKSSVNGMAQGVQVGESQVSGSIRGVLWRGTPQSFVNLNPPGWSTRLFATTGRIHVGDGGPSGAAEALINFGTVDLWLGLRQFLPPGYSSFSSARAVYQDGDTIYVGGWAESNATGYNEAILWTGHVACYANCDTSTQAPILNVADFSCFLQRFATADPYANCDGSTTAPVLNVADFTCFLQKFAAGCS